MMTWPKIASAMAQTATQSSAPQTGTTASDWWGPAFVGAIGGAIIAVLGTFLLSWYNHRKERQQQQAEQEKVLTTDEARYLDWLTHQHRFLPITGLRTRSPVEVDLERVYVSLTMDHRRLAAIGDGDPSTLPEADPSDDLGHNSFLDAPGREPEAISMAEALKAIDHNRVAGLVILGGPGTGKTTVLKYLALTYARGLYGERLDQSRPRLPLLIPLRAIGDGGHRQSLPDFLTQVCNRDGCRLSSDFFETKLRDGACLILLDGLDEVANEDQRFRVARWIETQCTAYPRNPVIVTCRIAGFQEHYLPPRFLRLDIQDFDVDNIAAFAHNWCLAVETTTRGDSDEARRVAERVSTALIQSIEANDRVKALAVNPLMLSIIALVHRYRGVRLPDRRVDLYAECVEVLLGHWDEAKDLPVPIPPGRSLQVLQPLALWMHEQKSGNPEERVARREELEVMLQPHLASIGLEAEAATTFLDSIKDRSGLLVEQGLNLFGFQHQTFQEYLAAREIADRSRTDLLVTHFGEGYWREVALLCAGMQNASGLLQGILSLPAAVLTAHWPLLLQLRDEALSVDQETRQQLFARPLDILQETDDARIAVRASLWLRQGKLDEGVLMRAFAEAVGELAIGHLALLLAETGSPEAIEVLKPYLTDDRQHVRYLAALALDTLGFDDRQILDDLLLVNIPAGEFTMGSQATRETPRKLRTEAYRIDRFPLTNGQYEKFVDAGGYDDPQYWSREGWSWLREQDVKQPRFGGDARFDIRSAPVVGISWYEANAYARWAGKRLPSEQEWERAARGDRDAREFPWGDAFEPHRSNTIEMELRQPSPVGSFPGGMSPHGCYDMAGNVWEWTASLYEEGSSARVLRGGAWHDLPVLARCSVRPGFEPRVRGGDIGVRLSRTF